MPKQLGVEIMLLESSIMHQENIFSTGVTQEVSSVLVF